MKRLIIAPHVDDDVLGCASVLDKDAVVLYCGVDDFHEVSARDRFMEAGSVHANSGARFYWPSREWAHELNFTPVAAVNSYQAAFNGFVHLIENVIAVEHPEAVFIPWPSYNQDHRAVYDAALVALRPHDRNFRVNRVLVYEGSQINFWDWHDPGVQFHPNYFVPLDITQKLRLYRMMPSQVRGMRSERLLRTLAALRGGEIGVAHAEAFQILRWVEVL